MFPSCRLRLRPRLSEYLNISKNWSQARLHLASATVIIRLQRHLTTRIKFLCYFSSAELTLAAMTHYVGVPLYLWQGESGETRTRQKDNNISHFESQSGRLSDRSWSRSTGITSQPINTSVRRFVSPPL